MDSREKFILALKELGWTDEELEDMNTSQLYYLLQEETKGE